MSIENDLKRIADALELIAKSMVYPSVTIAAPAPSTQSESKSEATPPQGAAEAINTAAPAPAPAVTPMTPRELNATLVKEFNRLGDRAPIDNALREMGVTGVTELPAERYQELLSKVQAISNG